MKRSSNYIISVETGTVVDVAAVRVTYDPQKSSYKKLLGVYWRNVNPVDGEGQFKDRGPSFRPVIWAASREEKESAETTRRMIERSGVYNPKKGVTRPPVELQVDIRFDPHNSVANFLQDEDDLDVFPFTDAADYDKAMKKSGRAKFFEEQFKPISTTACEGNVCGYVYFPCTRENFCNQATTGEW